jgi:glycosyltransferase involved in cell wall biosynthesis
MMKRYSKRLKCFHVLAGGPWGGGAVVVMSLTRALIEAGCQVWVLCLDDLVARRFEEIGARVVRSRHWRREISPLYDFLVWLQLYRLCRREKFDLVNTHTSKGGILGRLAARLAGVPRVIHTGHGFPFTETSSEFLKRFYILLERLAGYFCDLVISVNEEERQAAIRLGVIAPEKIVTVLNGIDMGMFDNVEGVRETRGGLEIPAEGKVVGTVGRLAEQKGFVYLIQAIPAILEACPQTWFVFAGSGPLESQLRSLAEELGVTDHCRFLGFRADIPQLLCTYDLFVLPSLWEGLSITQLEAMAAGRAVIATDIKGNREVISNEEDGLLVPPADPEALALAVVRLLLDPGLARHLGGRGRDKIRAHFSPEAMVEKTFRYYDLDLSGWNFKEDQPSSLIVQPL